MPTIRSLLIALSFVTIIGCGAEPADELPEVGGAAGHVEAGGAGGSVGTGGTAGSKGDAGGAAGAASTGGAVGTGGATASTGGNGGAAGGKGGAGGSAVVEPICGYVGQHTLCTRPGPGTVRQIARKGGHDCAICDGRSVAECTLVTPDKSDDDVACVRDCTECTDWL